MIMMIMMIIIPRNVVLMSRGLKRGNDCSHSLLGARMEPDEGWLMAWAGCWTMEPEAAESCGQGSGSRDRLLLRKG